MDRRDRLHDDTHKQRVLIVYGNGRRTLPVAQALASLLSKDGLVVELADADAGGVPPVVDYDAVIIGTAPRLRHHPRSIVQFIADQGDALGALPGFLFFVGGQAAQDLGSLAERTGWLPKAIARFARPPRLTRLFGEPNPSEICDIGALRSFALAIADHVPAHRESHPTQHEVETPNDATVR